MQHGPETEYWDCQGGFLAVELDGQGCPMQDKYCKIQVGPPGGPVTAAPGAPFTITITIANFTWAKIRGLVLSIFDAAAGNADLLHTGTITSVDVQGIENISGIVAADRYRGDATGSGKAGGTTQKWRGTIGSAAGNITIAGVNNSLATVIILAALDVDAMR